MRALLVGQPNSGKTTLFNRLTGRQETTGNRAGVTVGCVSGRLKSGAGEAVDLPGLYSFLGGGADEQAARETILDRSNDVVWNVLDSTLLARGLTLTLQLMALQRPMVVLLNLADEARGRGMAIDTAALSGVLGVPVYPISARTGEGLGDTARWFREARVPPQGVALAGEPLFQRANRIARAVTRQAGQPRERGIDGLLLHPVWGLPLFGLLIGLVFLVTFQWLGLWLGREVEAVFSALGAWLSGKGRELPLLLEGALACSGYVLSFLPVILVLSMLLSLLEDVGYLPRAAFLLDGWLRKLGLDGRCAVPLLLGLGCTVPALLSTRTLPEEERRRATARLLPFVPCSARLPFLLLLGQRLFAGHPARGALLFYAVSLGTGVAYGRMLSRGETKESFYLELPPLRLPRAESVLRETQKHALHFLSRAGRVLLPASLGLWLAARVGFNLRPAAGEGAILSQFGKLLLPLLRPLGLGDWRAGVILLSGIGAREAMAASAALFLEEGLALSAGQALRLGILAQLLPPCLGALAAARGEFGGRFAGRMALFHLLLAYGIGCFLNFILHIIGL